MGDKKCPFAIAIAGTYIVVISFYQHISMTMKNLFILLFFFVHFLLAGSVFCQKKFIDSIGVIGKIGEQDTIGPYVYNPNTYCAADFWGTKDTTFNYFIIPSGNREQYTIYFLYTPLDTSTVTLVGDFLFFHNFVRLSCDQGEDDFHCVASVKGTPNRTVRILPRYQLIALVPDTIARNWTGTCRLRFDNNTKDSALFNDWEIMLDSQANMKITVEASKDSIPILSYNEKPFEDQTFLDMKISLTNGPLYDTVIKRGIFDTKVTYDGTEYDMRNLIDLRLLPAPYKSFSKLDQDTLNFTNDPNTSVSKSVILHLDSAFTSYSIASASQPFSFSDTKINETTRELTFICNPKTGGIYNDRLRIDIYKPDFNGDSRQDSLYLNLRSEASTAGDNIFWQSFGSTSIAKKMYIPKKGDIYTSTGKKLFYSIDGGKSWVALSVPDSSCEQISFDTSGNIYRVAAYRGLNLSTDNGYSWGLQPVPAYTINCYPPITRQIYISTVCKSKDALYVSGSGNDSYPCGSGGSYVSGGESGTFRRSDNETSWPYVGDVGHLFLDSANNIIIVTGNKINHPPSYHHWSAPDSITAFAVDHWGNYLIGTQNSGIFRSADSGYSWENLRLSELNITAIAVAPSGEIFICSYGNGVFRSTDTGKNWEGVNGGLTTKKVNDIIAVPGEPLYLATEDAWVWKSKWIVPEKNVVKKSVHNNEIVFDIFPNPLQSNVEIHYFIPENETGQLSLHNILGQEFPELTTSEMLQGDGSLSFDLSHLPNGIYFCRLQSGANSIVKKILHY